MVHLPDGEYLFKMVLGTNGLLIEPLLYWAFRQWQRDDKAVIL